MYAFIGPACILFGIKSMHFLCLIFLNGNKCDYIPPTLITKYSRNQLYALDEQSLGKCHFSLHGVLLLNKGRLVGSWLQGFPDIAHVRDRARRLWRQAS